MSVAANSVGESQRRILEHLKRRGSSTIPVIAADLGLNVETVRTHLRSLGSDGFVARSGRRRSGRGRPEIVHDLTEAGEELFPNRESDVLHDLTRYLEDRGQRRVIVDFFEERVERRRAAALARVEGLEGDDRLDEVARILSEEGFMAEVRTDREGRRVLRLCHCPMRGLVEVTKAPCRTELGFVRELLGERLARISYIPSGDAACSYAISDGDVR